ncbi:MAG: hypothetical protein JWR08_717 [Enterovirga sp.]|jgi:opacity protein-like surface antigen|nr:hypothetical protein [Enterovirga sp.]
MIRATLALAAAASALALATPGGAAAQDRPSSVRMSCSQAAQLVLSRGALVLGTGGHTYDRYVADRSFCQPTETVRRAFVPTRDTPRCSVGYTCREPSLDDFFND